MNSLIYFLKNWHLPPKREVEFVIKIASGIASIPIALYRMKLTELKGLKALLQELLN